MAMNEHEKLAWRRLVELGGRVQMLMEDEAMLDVRPIRIRSQKAMSNFCHAFIECAGRSRSVRRHVDRRGSPVFLVTSKHNVENGNASD